MSNPTTTNPIVTAYFAYHGAVGMMPSNPQPRDASAYPSTLPAELASHYLWSRTKGHCVLALSPGNAHKFGDYEAQEKLHKLCVAVPVRSALRGYSLFAGHPVVECLEYSDATGYSNAHEDEDREL